MWTSDYRLLHPRTVGIHANTMHTLASSSISMDTMHTIPNSGTRLLV